MTSKKVQIKYVILIIILFALLAPRRDISGIKFFSLAPEKNLHNIKIKTSSDGKKIYALKDLTYEKGSISFITDIVLSFNVTSSRLRRDDTKKYKIRYSDYNFIQEKGSLGRGCAQFFKKKHGVKIETVRKLWLGSCKDLGSFTIEFRFLPYTVRSGSILFSRLGYFSGKKRGIEIIFKNGRTSAGLYGIFDRPDGQEHDISLNRGRLLRKGKWYHFSLSFDRISGKLAKYINGEEEDVAYITESTEPYNGVYAPSFGYRNKEGKLKCLDLPPAFIGKNYSGLIDEFRILYKNFEDLEKRTEIAYRNYNRVGAIGRIPFNIEGVITSQIYRFPETGTKVIKFKWKEKLEKNTFVWMQFRISDHNFKENDTVIKWYRIKNNQRKIFMMKKKNGDYLRGKYYQWRAHLISSPDGRYSPSLYDIEMLYRLDIPPNPPRFLEVVKAGDRYVILKWKKNMESDIWGYKIYYGTTPGKYDGIISRINEDRITNKFNRGDYIQVKITNDIIEKNKLINKRGLLSFPVLNNSVLYFFSVSAYDSYKPDSPYNHESTLLKHVTARPFAGTEID